MRRVLSLFVFLFITAIWVNTAYADYQWSKLSMDSDATVYISPNYEQDRSFFSVTGQDLYRSVDECKTWEKINTMPVWYVRAENDKNFYILQGADQKNTAIYKFNSLAQGVWEKLCDAPVGIKAFTVLNNGTVIAVKPSDSLSVWQTLRAEKPGFTWQDTGFTHGGEFLENTPDGLVFTRENTNNNVSKTSNYGVTWKQISSSYELNKFFASPLYTVNNEIFAIINNNRVNISYDRGELWYERMNGMESSAQLVCLSFSPGFKSDQTIYAANTEGRVFVTRDGSARWKSIDVYFEDGNRLNSLIVLPGDRLIAGAKNGVYELTSFIPPTRKASAAFIIGKSTYRINQEEWSMDTTPYVDDDRTFVPVRYLAYALGIDDAGILWDESKKEVTLSKNKTVVKISMDSRSLLVNNQPVAMDVLPQNNNGRVFLPARWVAQAFGAVVNWDGQKNSVVIEYEK